MQSLATLQEGPVSDESMTEALAAAVVTGPIEEEAAPASSTHLPQPSPASDEWGDDWRCEGEGEEEEAGSVDEDESVNGDEDEGKPVDEDEPVHMEDSF